MDRQGVPIRLWPGIVLAAIALVLWLAVPVVLPDFALYGILGGVLCALLVLIWWAFFSRAPRLERFGAVLLIPLALWGSRPLMHPSVQGGTMGMLIYFYGIPVMSVALVVWALATHRLPAGVRRATLVATILLVCAGFAVLRTDGIMGEGGSQFAWRWSPTAEERLIAAAPAPPPAPAQQAPLPVKTEPEPAAPTPKPAEWPGFRGPNRDSVVPAVRIRTDWSADPPVELWRKPIGPGWSSFAVDNGLLYTQEQRGEYELVSCYDAKTGEPVWTHRDKARFYESNGGPGPRGTPLLHGARVYSLGATGILNALDAKSGAVAWTRNASTDTGAKSPFWGFTSSPLIVGDTLLVAVSGVLAGYDPATGKPKWVAPKAGGSYSSPQVVEFGGTPQVVLMSSEGATGIAPTDGAVLWKHSWSGYPILQPAVTPDGALLITTGDSSGGLGTRRLAVTRNGGGWKIDEAWTSRGLKPYFNDLVVHKGHAYGFDGSILSCIDLKDGARKWKGGRYGHGQMLLLRDQDLLLVLSEEGELALVSATPDDFKELARWKAIEGKTWNHPVITRGTVVVRNGEEMAAFRLPR